MTTRPLASTLLLLALHLAACGSDDPTAVDPALAFALDYEPVSTEEVPVPGLPVPGTAASTSFERRPIALAVRRAVALVGARLWRHHADHFAQSYELRQAEPSPILDAFAVLTDQDWENCEFLPSRAIYEWAMTQQDLVADPHIQRETQRIEEALARDR